MKDFEALDWEKSGGLIPVIIQNSQTFQVLMLGYMNQEALQQTIDSTFVTFYSRSKKRLWQKGETSGNKLKVESIKPDCDNDTLLIEATPQGPTCHLGHISCFGDQKGGDFLMHLDQLITQREKDRPSNSYTTKLFEEGLDRMAQKVGEEAIEVVLASKNPSKEEFLGECGDLLFHLMVLLKSKGLGVKDVVDTLSSRHLSS